MYKIVCFILLILSITSCLKEKAAFKELECVGVEIGYEEDIEPLIKQSCATNLGPGTGCHDAWIFDYVNVTKKIKDGSWEQRVLDLKDMPIPENAFGIEPLTNDELITFKCWIAAGYSN